MKTCYTITFENKSDNYIVLGDGKDIVFAGSKDEADKIYNQYDPEYDPKCPYSLIEIVDPHQTVTHNMVHQPISIDNVDFTSLFLR